MSAINVNPDPKSIVHESISTEQTRCIFAIQCNVIPTERNLNVHVERKIHRANNLVLIKTNQNFTNCFEFQRIRRSRSRSRSR